MSEYSQLMGNYYIWRAKLSVALVEMEYGRIGDARVRIEAILSE